MKSKALIKMKNNCYTEGVTDFVNLVSKVAVLRELRLNFASIMRELNKIQKTARFNKHLFGIKN